MNHYQKEFLHTLRDSNNWPSIRKPETLECLDSYAEDESKKENNSGYISAVLIYHQITEEMIRCLINITIFYMQCNLFPLEYEVKITSKAMFGKLISILKDLVQFENSSKFISDVEKLNSLRIKIVHKLINEHEQIPNIFKTCKELYDVIYIEFDELYDYVRLSLKDFKKNIEEMEEDLEE